VSRVLAVAALAFPTRQGTQGLVREECLALAKRGHDVHLACYGAAGFDASFPFAVHRTGDWPRLSALRSGPLPEKPVLDLRLARTVRRLVRSLAPDVVVAHHVEALAACAVPRVGPRLVYRAHTRLDLELPTYFPSANGAGDWLGRTAGAIERRLARSADQVIAVAPDLAESLGGEYVPPGIDLGPALPRRPTPREVLYQGNLDAYQGLDVLFAAFSIVANRGPVTLRIATASPPADVVGTLSARGLAHRVRIERLGDLGSARRALSRAAVVVVPRRVPGGFPIKLVEALAACAPVVVSRRAAHGLVDGVHARVVPDDDAPAMAGAIEALFADPVQAERLGAAGRAHAERTHGEAAFQRLEAALLA